MNKEEKHGLVKIHECADDSEAEIIVSFLLSEGIEASFETNVPHSILPVAGDASVFVNEADAEKARKLLEEHEPHKKTKSSPPRKAHPKKEENE